MSTCRMRTLPILTALVVGLVPHVGFAQSDGLTAAVALEQTLTQVIEQAEPSVVSIARLRPAPSETTGFAGERGNAGTGQDVVPNQFSAGVLMIAPGQTERFVLTAYHSVRGGVASGKRPAADSSRLEVRLSSRHACTATIYAADPRSDLALLRLDLKELGLRADELRAIPWPAQGKVRKGQFVISLANPYWIARDGSASAMWGIVSNISRRPAVLVADGQRPNTLPELGHLIQVDHRLPVGCSGAPVLNLRGELIALSSSIAAIEGHERSGGFAIPLDSDNRWIVDDLLRGYEVEYGFLGIQPRRVEVTNYFGLDEVTRQPGAVEVFSMNAGTPAAFAGLRLNDLILAINDQPTLSEIDLMRVVTLYPPETTVKLQVYRPSQRKQLTLAVKLGKWPVRDWDGIVAPQRRHPLWRGLGVDYPTARNDFLQTQLPVPTAVLITEVTPESPAKEAGLEPGQHVTMVRQTPVRTPAEFTEALKGATGPVPLTILLPDLKTKTVVLREPAMTSKSGDRD